MTKLAVPLLAAITVFAVAFVLWELHAPLSSSTAPTSAPSPPPIAPRPLPPVAAPPVAAPPVAAPAPSPPAAQTEPPAVVPPPAAAPSENPPPAQDPLDVVVRGKTRREWHAYYAERQQEMVADIQRYQSVIDRAVAGEEPDPRELGEAHEKVRELNARMKEDLEALQQIDATP